ncbi:unnamed protein product [Somion occarium]|uniref:Uncharacterized protein n=1 Tax=Somion occarium TaxID=3059160 RepID=A0ABP1E1J6_9APHY
MCGKKGLGRSPSFIVELSWNRARSWSSSYVNSELFRHVPNLCFLPRCSTSSCIHLSPFAFLQLYIVLSPSLSYNLTPFFLATMIKFHPTAEISPPEKPCGLCMARGGHASFQPPLVVYVTIHKTITYSNEESPPPTDLPSRCATRNDMSGKGGGMLSSHVSRQSEDITPIQESGGSPFATPQSSVV